MLLWMSRELPETKVTSSFMWSFHAKPSLSHASLPDRNERSILNLWAPQLLTRFITHSQVTCWVSSHYLDFLYCVNQESIMVKEIIPSLASDFS